MMLDPLAGCALGPLAEAKCRKSGGGIPQDGLISYWKMEEGSGNRLDSHGTNHAVPTSCSQVAGKIGNAVYCQPNGYLTVTDVAALRPSAAMTFRVWAYWGTSASNRCLASKWAYRGNGAWGLQTYSTNALSVYIATSANDDGSGCAVGSPDGILPIGSWVHVVMVFDGSLTGLPRLKFYVNGVAKATFVTAGAIPSTLLPAVGANLHIGRFEGISRYVEAYLDEALIASRAWTAAEVLADYNSGNGITY